MSKTVEACPECDNTSIVTAPGGYRCTECGNHFEEPNTRDSEGNAEAGHKGKAKILCDANPKEWP